MGYAFLVCNCAGCGRMITCNPAKVPSVRVNGEKQAICQTCFNRWNQIHRISKGLEPVPLHPEAYQSCDENELGDCINTMNPGTTYDYQTRWFPGETRISFEDDKKVVGLGWDRVWADITETGTFVVYRKTVWMAKDQAG